MRSLNLGILAVGGLFVAASPWDSPAQPTQVPQAAYEAVSAGGLITHTIAASSGGDRIVVIDPAAKTMAVYRIGRDRGEITLDSVRNLSWDLRMLHFNTSTPTPDELRAGFERQP